MKNVSTVYSDGINIYIAAEIKSKVAGRLLLGLTLIIAIVLFIYLLISIDFKEMGKASIPIILIPSFFLYILSRYLLWNIYGQEHIVVNSKTVTYYYNYGFFRTPLKTVFHNRLGISYRITDRFEDENFGRMIFVNYNQDTNLPEALHETAVEINEKTATEIERLLEKVVLDKFNEDRDFIFLEN